MLGTYPQQDVDLGVHLMQLAVLLVGLVQLLDQLCEVLGFLLVLLQDCVDLHELNTAGACLCLFFVAAGLILLGALVGAPHQLQAPLEKVPDLRHFLQALVLLHILLGSLSMLLVLAGVFQQEYLEFLAVAELPVMGLGVDEDFELLHAAFYHLAPLPGVGIAQAQLDA